MPLIEEQQPPGGPTPTPSPRPTVCLEIIAIGHALPGGGAVLTLQAPIGALQVNKDFMDLGPLVGDYYAKNSALKWVITAADYAARFPQT